MRKIVARLSRAVRAAESALGPQRYQSAGKVIVCSQCGCELLNRTIWFHGYGFECSRCNLQLSFTVKPEWIREGIEPTGKGSVSP
jgi:hypothetical protein